jgi:branched-chain amino acid transport system permease protein
MRKLLFGGIPTHGWWLLALLAAALFAAPAFANDYFITVLIVIFYFAYAGQSWNIMMGFAGQLSLGHALYVGLGAYAAAALYVHFGIGPWIGVLASIVVSGAVAAVLGYLAFRFGVGGVYFAILTIAFAEFARVGFDHFKWVNSSSGLFLPVAQYSRNDLWNLRGSPVMFYYVMLVLMFLALAICRMLLRSRLGYYWQAIREDEEAARSLGIDTFRCKMAAVVISGAMTSVAGMFFAFFYNNLFPEQVFNIGRSIEIILGPFIGGVGSLFGPIVGAFLLTVFSESVTSALATVGIETPGYKQVFYGLALLLVIVVLPHGVWPPIARFLRLRETHNGKGEP